MILSNLEFTAFKVHKGDCFMLKDLNKEFIMVVDGGDYQSNTVENILGMTKKIDVLICTHYDGDHVEGIIDLLKETIFNSNSLVIKEVWLPDFFQRIIATVSKEPAWLRTDMRNLKQLEILNKALIKGIGIEENIEGDIEEHIEEKKILKEEMEQEEVEDDIKALVENYIIHKRYKNIDTVVDRIAILMFLCFLFEDHYNGKVRFFEYEDNVVNYKVKKLEVDIIGVNCKEIGRKVRLYNKKDLIYHLTRINIESLVFRYNKINDSGGEPLPNVLFNADSDYSFTKSGSGAINFGVDYKTLVTAPHHGSSHGHKDVYSTLKSVTPDFVMVRSDMYNPPSSRPCIDYVNHHVAYKRCTICNSATSNADGGHVFYEFINGSWITHHKRCNCEYKGLSTSNPDV